MRTNTLVATAFAPPNASGPVLSSPVSTFSVQVTDATSRPRTLTSTSVRKNWMYGVFAMISAHERLIAPGAPHRQRTRVHAQRLGVVEPQVLHRVEVGALERLRRTRR